MYIYLCSSTQIMLFSFSTYSCDCPAGWKGNFCTETVSTCDPEHDLPPQCSKGAIRVALPRGYICFCPLGTTGIYCEQGEAEFQLMLPTDLTNSVSFGERKIKYV